MGNNSFCRPCCNENEIPGNNVTDKIPTNTKLFPEQTTQGKLNRLFNQVSNQIIISPVYDRILNKQFLLQILQNYKKHHLTYEQADSILKIVFQYMEESKKCSLIQQQSDSNSYQTFVTKIGQKVNNLQKEIQRYNKDILKVISSICGANQGNKNNEEISYFNLNYDLAQNQVKNVVKIVREAMKNDPRAFSFMTNYFVLSCLNLQKKGKFLNQIQSSYLTALKKVSELYPKPPQPEQVKQLTEKHPTWKAKSTHRHNLLDLSATISSGKSEKLEDFIIHQVQQAKNYYESFNQIIKEPCLKNGFKFNSGIKLQQRKQKQKLFHIKEEIMLDILNSKMHIEQYANANSNKKHSFQGLAQFQLKLHQQKIQGHVSNSKLIVQCNSLLWGQCIFSQYDKLHQCCDELKNIVQKDAKLTLLSVKNGLFGKERNGYLLLNILLQDKVQAEIKLIYQIHFYQYQFQKNLQTLNNSKKFTPLTALQKLNRDLSYDFFQEADVVISKALKQPLISTEDLGIINQRYGKFILSAPFSLRNQRDQSKFYAFMVQQRIINFRAIKQQQTIFSRDDQWMFFWSNHKYNVARKKNEKNLSELKTLVEKYSQKLKNNKNNLSNSSKQTFQIELQAIKQHFKNYKISQKYAYEYLIDVGKIYQKKKPSISYNIYKQCLKLNEKLNKNLNNQERSKVLCKMALIDAQKQNYAESMKFYEESMSILQKIKGEKTVQYAHLCKNLAAVYNRQKKLKQAQKYYLECLQIYKKHSSSQNRIEEAAILFNLGTIYSNMNDYKKAQEYLQKNLTIVQQIKGRQSMQYAAALKNTGLIYSNQNNQEKAVKTLEKSLQIRSLIKGDESLQSAQIIHLIGIIYVNNKKQIEAKEYFQQSLSIRESLKGKDSKECLQSLSQLIKVCKILDLEIEAKRYEFRQKSIIQNKSQKKL